MRPNVPPERAALGGTCGRRQPGASLPGRGWTLQVANAVAIVLLTGCSSGPDNEESASRSAEVDLVAAEQVLLDESDEAYVSTLVHGYSRVAFARSGEIAVVDGAGRRLLLFDRSGSLLRWAGREGDGPGEYRNIQHVAWDPEGRLWVSDNQRITVLDRDLAVDTTFRVVGDADYAGRMVAARGGMLVAEHGWPVEGPAVRRYDLSGQPGPVIFNVPPRDGEPYVLQQFRSRFHVVGDTVVVASSVSYPLYLHDLEGNLLGTFGTRPPSIGEMTYPGSGAFTGERQVDGAEWLRSFGTVSSIWVVHDSLIAVEHARRHPEPGGIPLWRFWMDVYDRWTLEKRLEDLPLPGFVVDVHDDLLWLLTDTPLTSDPVGGPWGMTGYRIQVERGPG